jgi:hypothetical protein
VRGKFQQEGLLVAAKVLHESVASAFVANGLGQTPFHIAAAAGNATFLAQLYHIVTTRPIRADALPRVPSVGGGAGGGAGPVQQQQRGTNTDDPGTAAGAAAAAADASRSGRLALLDPTTTTAAAAAAAAPPGDHPAANPALPPLSVSTGAPLAPLSALLPLVHAPDRAGREPLHYAVLGGHSVAAAWLLRHGASLDAADSYGTTPLHYAVNRADPSLVGLLIDAAAENLPSAGGAAPHGAARRASPPSPSSSPADPFSLLRSVLTSLDGQSRRPLDAAWEVLGEARPREWAAALTVWVDLRLTHATLTTGMVMRDLWRGSRRREAPSVPPLYHHHPTLGVGAASTPTPPPTSSASRPSDPEDARRSETSSQHQHQRAEGNSRASLPFPSPASSSLPPQRLAPPPPSAPLPSTVLGQFALFLRAAAHAPREAFIRILLGLYRHLDETGATYIWPVYSTYIWWTASAHVAPCLLYAASGAVPGLPAWTRAAAVGAQVAGAVFLGASSFGSIAYFRTRGLRGQDVLVARPARGGGGVLGLGGSSRPPVSPMPTSSSAAAAAAAASAASAAVAAGAAAAPSPSLSGIIAPASAEEDASPSPSPSPSPIFFASSSPSPVSWVAEPGHPTDADAGQCRRAYYAGLEAGVEGGATGAGYCVSCEIVRPPRSKHCARCGVCVRRFDHCCPWVGGDVGERSHGAFLLFVLAACVTCLAWLVMLALFVRAVPAGSTLSTLRAAAAAARQARGGLAGLDASAAAAEFAASAAAARFGLWAHLSATPVWLVVGLQPVWMLAFGLLVLWEQGRLIAHGLTSNERVNHARYAYLRDAETGRFRNPYAKAGAAGNCSDFWSASNPLPTMEELDALPFLRSAPARWLRAALFSKAERASGVDDEESPAGGPGEGRRASTTTSLSAESNGIRARVRAPSPSPSRADCARDVSGEGSGAVALLPTTSTGQTPVRGGGGSLHRLHSAAAGPVTGPNTWWKLAGPLRTLGRMCVSEATRTATDVSRSVSEAWLALSV